MLCRNSPRSTQAKEVHLYADDGGTAGAAHQVIKHISPPDAPTRLTRLGHLYWCHLRYAMLQAAHNAVEHPKWRRELERLEPRIGRSKAIVAIARKLLVIVWHVLTKEVADRHAIPVDVAKSFFRLAYRMGVRQLKGESALTFTRRNLDRLKLGQELTILPWGNKRFKLPPSSRASPENG